MPAEVASVHRGRRAGSPPPGPPRDTTGRPAEELPLVALFAPSPPDPADMPADPRDQRAALVYWRARGIRPPWAGRVGAGRLVTRAQVQRLARGLVALGADVGELAEVVARLDARRASV